MVNVLAAIFQAFVFGMLTPLTAVCVIPLYPGFLSYLSGQLAGSSKTSGRGEETSRRMLVSFGLIITAGVIFFMLLLGLVFTKLLQVSLTLIIGIVSPIAFGFLIILSLGLIFDVDLAKYLPRGRAPKAKNPYLTAFLYGFFFGAIVVPCQPAFIAALFAIAVSSPDFLVNMLRFLFFGLGIGFPLLLFSAVSTKSSRQIIAFLVGNRRNINLGTGVIMLVVSIYYLVFVFRIFG